MQHINLRDELDRAQGEVQQERLLDEARKIISSDYILEEAIAMRMKQYSVMSVMFDERILKNEPIYDLQTIENICTKFRMRFLDSEMYAGEVPTEALHIVRRLEKEYNMTLVKFKIIAPANRFKLKDSTEDPILLAELPNGQYVFIYQWGDHMRWYQRFLKYPYQHMGALTISSCIIGLIVALIIPFNFGPAKLEIFFRFFMFSATTALLIVCAIIYGIMRSKDFSENVWNSKFL